MKITDEKVKVYSTAFAAIAVPIVVIVIGNIFSAAIQKNQSEQKFVELAIDILREKPNPESDTEQLRVWATEVVSKYSGVPLEGAGDLLIKSIQLPKPSLYSSINSSDTYIPITPLALRDKEIYKNGNYPNQRVQITFIEPKFTYKVYSDTPIQIKKNSTYEIIADYSSYTAIQPNEFSISKDQYPENKTLKLGLAGYSIRTTATFLAKKDNLFIDSLFGLGELAEKNLIEGVVNIQVIGITVPEIATHLPIPSTISIDSINKINMTIEFIKQEIGKGKAVFTPTLFALIMDNGGWTH